MLYSDKSREDFKKLNKLASLGSQVKTVRLQDKLGKRNFHEKMKRVFQPVNKSIKGVSEEVKKNYDGKFYQKQQSTREFKRQTFRNNQ